MERIVELRLEMMGQEEAARIRSYLEFDLHCRMTYMSEGSYLLRFPDGTTEQECTQPDPKYKQETVITLPNGVILRKVVKYPCIHPHCTHTHLILPNLPEEGPKRMRQGSSKQTTRSDL